VPPGHPPPFHRRNALEGNTSQPGCLRDLPESPLPLSATPARERQDWGGSLWISGLSGEGVNVFKSVGAVYSKSTSSTMVLLVLWGSAISIPAGAGMRHTSLRTVRSMMTVPLLPTNGGRGLPNHTFGSMTTSTTGLTLAHRFDAEPR
jgi:hypothetical protein